MSTRALETDDEPSTPKLERSDPSASDEELEKSEESEEELNEENDPDGTMRCLRSLTKLEHLISYGDHITSKIEKRVARLEAASSSTESNSYTYGGAKESTDASPPKKKARCS